MLPTPALGLLKTASSLAYPPKVTQVLEPGSLNEPGVAPPVTAPAGGSAGAIGSARASMAAAQNAAAMARDNGPVFVVSS